MRVLGLSLAVAALATAAIACGEDPEARFRLRTPPEHSSAKPLPEIKREQEQAERDARIRPSQKDAERIAPILRGWGEALRHNDDKRATRYFALPAIVEQGQAIKLETAAQVRAFNAGVPCGAKLLRVRHDGRFVVGTFKLTERPHHQCTATGARIRVAFFVRNRKIAEWRLVPDTPGAEPGPERPEGAPDPPLKKVS